MNQLTIRSSLLLLASNLAAQCAPAATSILTLDPPAAQFYVGSPSPLPTPYNGFMTLWDMEVSGTVDITGIGQWLYDEGAGLNPNQVGNTAPVTVWVCPTTYVGRELNPTAWTQVGTGTITVTNSAVGLSPVVLAAPITLTPGSYGVGLQIASTTAGPLPPFGPLHPLVQIPPTVPTVSDQFLTIRNGNTQADAFASGIGANDGINIQVSYTPAAASAVSAQFGAGCYFRPRSFYESFPVPPAAFDLSNQAMTLLPNGTANYTVAAGSPAIVPPVSGPLVGLGGVTAMGDDDVSAALSLPFTFHAPGGISTTTIVVGSNGTVWLDGIGGDPFGFYGDVARFLTDGPRFAVAFGDWDPSTTGSGTVHFDVDASNQSVRVTWNNVQEWNAAAAHLNAQIELFASGQVDIRYGTCSMSVAPVLVGFSTNEGTSNGSQNLSTGGIVTPFTSGDGMRPPVLQIDARPVLGTTPAIVTSNIPSGTLFNILALGFANIPNGLSLAALGMPGCNQYLNLPVTTLFGTVAGGVHTQPFPLPNVPAYAGLLLYGQSAPMSAGFNAANIVTSNGLCLRFGTL